jgi:aspartyl/asparaginyl-tRNA synthetase
MSSSVYQSSLIIEPKKFSFVVNKLRTFFLSRGYIEVHTQNRLSILAACEDVDNITSFTYGDVDYPLPQTGQMWLEYHMMRDPSVPGYFCVSTSYRNEANPVPGRHDVIFPMFEFELHGDMETLIMLERDLLEYLGYDVKSGSHRVTYGTMSRAYGVDDLTHQEEQRMYREMGPVVFLTNFPESTNPFWNMARAEDGTAAKIDVILSGMETIGSAQRSCNPEEMRNLFKTIKGGSYADTLYDSFGVDRVDGELDDFLRLPFIVRSGGGIGLTRLIRSMEKEGLLRDVI